MRVDWRLVAVMGTLLGAALTLRTRSESAPALPILPPEAALAPAQHSVAGTVKDRVCFGIGLVVGGIAAALVLASLL